MRGFIRFGLAIALIASFVVSTGPAARPAGGTVHSTVGYWVVDAAGGVHALGAARAQGSPPPGLAQPIVGVTATPTGDGYWLVASDGGVFALGDARFLGSTGGRPLNRPIVGMASTPTGRGYWLVASDGGVFSFGDAMFHGSTGGLRLNAPITGMAATRTGGGYWLVAADGGLFSFGDAMFHGSTGDRVLNRPIVGMAATPSGRGYWFVASDGGVFSFGDARFHGSTGGLRLNAPITAMAPSRTGGGYWLAATDGGVFTFGDAPFLGSLAGGPRSAAIVGLAVAPIAAGSGSGIAPPAGISPSGLPLRPGPESSHRAFSVGLVGDTGYTAEQAEDFLRVRDHMNRFPLAFTVHDGDIWSGTTSCTDSRYADARAVFDGFLHPVVYTPGDNEWADCSGPDDRLAHLRRVFFPTAESLGTGPFPVTRQYPTYVENARWSAGDVVFATLNVPGPDGEAGDHAADLKAAAVAWLNATFDEAARSNSAAVMVIWQDNPFVPATNGELVRTLKRRAQAFGRPVVLVHGDTHEFRIDHPWSDVPLFTRVETFAADDSHKWVRATVDPSAPGVFSFEEMTS